MYQSIKDLYKIIERNRRAQKQILEKQKSFIGDHNATSYTRGFIAGLDSALGLLNVLLDEYETEPQPSNADETDALGVGATYEEKQSDALDFVAFMKQCRP